MTPRIFPHTRCRRFVCLFLCSLISIGAWATEPANSEASAGQAHTDNSARTLRTFEAIYKTSALGMTLDLTRFGRTSQFIDILEPAEAPQSGNGLYFMDSSSAAAECVTLMAAGGAVIHTFPTGQGNVVGNPIVPVVKITANPRTVRTMSEHVDVDVSGILRREMTIDEAGDELIDMICRTANGRNTAAEALGHREFSMTKLYRSA